MEKQMQPPGDHWTLAEIFMKGKVLFIINNSIDYHKNRTQVGYITQ